MAEINYLDESEISFDKIDFKWALIRHIDRIGNLTSMTQSDKQATLQEREALLSLSVKLFENMLIPYVDDKYKNELEEKKFEQQGKELAAALHKYGCLMRLLKRRGFLMASFVIGGA